MLPALASTPKTPRPATAVSGALAESGLVAFPLDLYHGKVADVIALMHKKNISAVPVTEQGKLAGVVTRRSFVNAL